MKNSMLLYYKREISKNVIYVLKIPMRSHKLFELKSKIQTSMN